MIPETIVERKPNMTCEGCGKKTVGYDVFDYCAHCGKNLCEGCMAQGCCGKVPADSGQGEEDEADDGSTSPEEE